MFEELEKGRARDFLKHLAIASYKVERRREARDELEKQIQNIKRISSERTKDKNVLEKEIEILKEQIEHLLQVESKLINKYAEDQGTSNDMKVQVRKLEDKIDRYMQSKEQRQKRVEEIERKIKGKVSETSSEIPKIENHISMIERQVALLQKQGKASNDDADKMKARIEGYRKKIEELRRR